MYQEQEKVELRTSLENVKARAAYDLKRQSDDPDMDDQ
jgi:hypothetical protein